MKADLKTEKVERVVIDESVCEATITIDGEEFKKLVAELHTLFGEESYSRFPMLDRLGEALGGV